jgi:hypothetical protein
LHVSLPHMYFKQVLAFAWSSQACFDHGMEEGPLMQLHRLGQCNKWNQAKT